jgi:hypothetical protein
MLSITAEALSRFGTSAGASGVHLAYGGETGFECLPRQVVTTAPARSTVPAAKTSARDSLINRLVE